MSSVTLHYPNTVDLHNVHSLNACVGRRCVIHNQSRHHMSSWRMYWRGDRGMMERLCPMHGVGHPDPDGLEYFMSIGRGFMSVHGCCGCCGIFQDVYEPETSSG